MHGCCVDVQSGELLIEFFQFYADFNFAEHGVSVVSGSAVEKPDPSVPVYIENPLERELNVSKNILEADLQLFQTHCRLARDTLRETSMVPRSRQKGDPWGLLSILKTDDQLLTEDSETVSEDVAVMPSQDDVDDTDHVDHQPPQSPAVGVVDIHDILHRDDDANDKVADNVSTRTL